MPTGPTLVNGRFQIDSLIARGGMATVFKGTDLTLGRTVAVKILSEDLAQDPSFLTRFRLEAQAAASLTHPNIVAVFDTGSDGDTHYIVMEYLQGRTLHQILKEDGPLPPREVATIGADVAQALAEAHNKGIVHRDVKPGNIMIGPTGTAKVMDFGIAKAATSGNLTQVGSILGTVAYLSPEQARGEPVDGRSDIYSLGSLLYQMLTGKLPLKGDTYVEMVQKLSSENPDPPSSVNPAVPRRLDAVVMRALAKDPDDRYQTGTDMEVDLTASLTPRAVGNDAPGFAEENDKTAVAQRSVPAGDDATRVLPVIGSAGSRPPSSKGNTRTLILAAALVALLAIAFVMIASLNDTTTTNPEPTPTTSFSPAAPPPAPATAPAPAPAPVVVPSETPEAQSPPAPEPPPAPQSPPAEPPPPPATEPAPAVSPTPAAQDLIPLPGL